MAEAKFTPGPWDFEPSGKEAGYIGFPDGSGFYAAIRAGDGHLIAAAPELYEALFRLSVDCKLAGLEDQAGFDCWLNMADEALAKAEGRS